MFEPSAPILSPWRERERLHARIADWIDLPLPPPPNNAELREQCVELLRKQQLLQTDAESIRRDEIIRELDLELSGYLWPLGIDENGSYPETETLFLMVADLCEEVGLRYKSRHASYPSNHSFLSFSIAFLFSRVYPEHPGIGSLILSARRIAENREWGGVHYAADTKAGHDLARLFVPILEDVLREQMLRAQSEWL